MLPGFKDIFQRKYAQARGTVINPWIRALVNNSTEGDEVLSAMQAAAPVTIDESSDPSANYYVGKPSAGVAIAIMPFGTNANAEAFDMTVRGWKHVLSAPGSSPIPSPNVVSSVLFVGTCTLGSVTGISGGEVTDSEFFCSSIAQSAGIEDYKVMDHATGSFVRIDNAGFGLISIEFDLNTAASANCLVSGF
jgi:hypothetical protein